MDVASFHWLSLISFLISFLQLLLWNVFDGLVMARVVHLDRCVIERGKINRIVTSFGDQQFGLLTFMLFYAD